ncbi:MAG TPA: two-component system response regulator [Deltaproteobacteria bacterium]|nr:two-component system response regulator [Deltaproteobacteria bacterium]
MAKQQPNLAPWLTPPPDFESDLVGDAAQQRSVLVIDDSPMVRQQLRRLLVDAGFAVVEAVDGAEGKRLLETRDDFVLVLCDVLMPRLDGVEMLEAIQAEAQGVSVPVIMLTTEGQPALLKRAVRAGARGWVMKPFRAELLLRVAKRLVE